jgi:hypothetical protein
MNKDDYEKYLTVRLSNRYTRHYQAHVEDGNVRQRKKIARLKLERMEELEISNSYFIELLADYILADDHLRGLSLMREATKTAKDNEEYPPLGEGAREFHQREWGAGDVLTIGERRRVKVCEICESPFIDNSRAKNAKVCGDTCRGRKEALRKRADYNESELGLFNETRLKRYRVRQDHEYPFYSPQEMYEMSVRSERVYSDDQLERVGFKQHDASEWTIAGETIEVSKPKFHGKRKPMWVGNQFDELSDKVYNNAPKGRSRFIDTEESKNGPVIVRKISVDVTEAQLEAEKWANANKIRGLGVLIPRHDKENLSDTSENHAI